MSIEINPDIVNTFNDFLKIKNPLKPSKTAFKRYNFLVNEIINNRYAIRSSYQYCTTKLGNKYESHHSTIGKWLKTLVSLGYLKVTNSKWHKGDFSKRYKITEFRLDDINKFNGYNLIDKFKKSIKKKIDRKKKLKNFNPLTYDHNNAVFLASGWLGCPKQFMSMVKKEIPKSVLKAPREYNIRQTKHWDFLKAYNYVAKKNKGYKRITEKEWAENFFEYDPIAGEFEKGNYDRSEIKDHCLNYIKILKFNKDNAKGCRKRIFELYNGMIKAYDFLIKGKELENKYVPMSAL